MSRRPFNPMASMTLLRETMERPLDPGYAAAAERRGERGRRPWWHGGLVVIVAAALGLTTVWAARELRAPAPGTTAARELLVGQIEDRSRRAERILERNHETVNAIEELQARSLTGADGAFLDRIRELGVNAGSVAVSGPGVVVTLDDSRDAQQGAPGSELGFVQDLDLQILVNALWASGAEAIAINGHRLSTLSPIRSAGRAILVDLAPLTRPYVVEAIGTTQDLQARLARSTGGNHLATLGDVFGISVSIDSAEDLVLPGSSVRALRYAEAIAPREAPEGAS